MLTYSHADSIEEQFSIAAPSPLQRVEADWLTFFTHDPAANKKNSDTQAHRVEVWCKRDDLLHDIISGNKWRKLAKPLQNFIQTPPSHVLSFGGPYSNHLHALSYCCNQLNIKFTAIIRGAYLRNQPLNPTLQDLKNWNANLVFVDKQHYQKRTEQAYLATLRRQFDADIIIPEGGSQQDALFGMHLMMDEISAVLSNKPFDAILLPVASGGTMAGVIESCSSEIASQIVGIGVLQGKDYLETLVSQFLPNSKINNAINKDTPYSCHDINKDTPYLPWHINHDFHFGGYAKSTESLDAFCTQFNQQQAKQDTPVNVKSANAKQANTLRIEPVYSGKCFFALKTLIQQGHFAPNSKILIIHTGGLQGAR